MLKMSKLTAWKSTHNNKLFCALIAAFAVKIGNSAACFVHNSLGNFNGFIRNDIGNAAFVKAVKNAVRCLFDGIYGNAMSWAIKQFKHENGLSGDSVDAETWRALGVMLFE